MIKKFASLGAIPVLFLSILAGCNISSTAIETEAAALETTKKAEAAALETTKKAEAAALEMTKQRPIIVQGPMPIEVENFVAKLENVTEATSGTFVFYKGTVDGYPVIVTKTGKGMENTAAATGVAIERYNPIAIINQGTSGGHDPSLNVYDIVLGKRVVNIGSLKTGDLAENEGIQPTKWMPMDLLASEGSVEEDSNVKKARYYEGDAELLAAANAVKDSHTKGKVVEGTIGSANVWNNEVDRIKWFHENFGTSVEEMEGASAAQIAQAYDVPSLVIRILSNNKTNAGKYEPNTAAVNQEYVYEVVKEYISSIQ